MTEKINIVYIGPKPQKKDTVYHTHLVFPAGVSIPVDVDDAYKFLNHPGVWVKESDYAQVKEKQQAKAKAELLAQAQAEATRQAELAEMNLTVPDYGDLGKMHSAKLKTVVECESLGLVMGDGEAVRDFAYRIRDALKAKAETAEIKPAVEEPAKAKGK